MSKNLTIISGANGSGKTTLAKTLTAQYDLNFINADEIAKEIDPNNKTGGELAAGRVFFRRINKQIELGKSFAIESTLSGLYLKRLISQVKERGYNVELIYIFLQNPEVCIERIHERVLKGGHFVPREAVIRRYYRSKNNFWNIYRYLVNSWYLVYNSELNFHEFCFGSREEFSISSQNIFQEFMENIEVKMKVDNLELYQKAFEIQRIGDEAVQAALKENKELNIPSVFSRDGIIYYLMPSGEITTKSPFKSA